MKLFAYKSPLVALLAIAFACQLGGCSKKDEAAAPAAVPAVASAPAAPAGVANADQPATADQQADAMDEKLNAYIKCYNRIDERAHRSISRYQSWVKDMKAGPSGKETLVYGLYQIDGETIGECKQSFAQATALKPGIPLDAAATTYINALDAFNQVVEEAYSYYERGNYKDDKFAKGKALHPQLVAQMTAFQAASEKFSDAIEEVNDKRLDAEMAQLEKEDGRKLPYLRMATMRNAKLLSRLIGNETFPADQAAAKLEAYEKIVDETLNFAKANKGSAPSSWFTFESATEDFRKAAKERVRRIRDKVPYNEGEKMMLKPGSAWMVEGSEEKVSRAYNNLVETSNSLH